MRITSPKLDTLHLSRNEEVFFRCQKALELKDAGNYLGAQEVMRPFWKGVGERPETTGLHASVAAELLVCVGVLTCWISSKDQSKVGQEAAKNLISEGMAFYESINDIKKIAAAQIELAYCYWYEGELNEARTVFTEALQKLATAGNTKAKALVGLAIVEWSASRYDDAYSILSDNAPLFKKITDHTIKAIYHNQLALVLRGLAKSEGKLDYLRRAVHEYEEADRHLKFTRNVFFQVDLKNNVAVVLRHLKRFKQAHKYLAEARRLAVSVKDKLRVAQVDETRAQVFIAEGKLNEAESIARRVVSVFAQTDRKALLADALITHAISLARLNQPERSQVYFQRATEVASQVGALNKAGLASLTMIEEVEKLSLEDLQGAFIRACNWLSECQSKELLLRLIRAGEKLAVSFGGLLSTETAKLDQSPRFHQAVLEYERSLIRPALARVNGRVTQAALLLGLSHQGLAYIIAARHPDLLKERTPVHHRQRKKP